MDKYIWCEKQKGKPKFRPVEICYTCSKRKKCKEYKEYLTEHLSEEGNNERLAEVSKVKRRRRRLGVGNKIQQRNRVRATLDGVSKETSEIPPLVGTSNKGGKRSTDGSKDVGSQSNTGGNRKVSSKRKKVLSDVVPTRGTKKQVVSESRNGKATEIFKRSGGKQELLEWAC